MKSITDIISENPIFQAFPKNTLEELGKTALTKAYQAGEIIVHQGDPWPFLFIVIQGKVNAVKESAAGRSLIATTITEGEIFWGLAFFIENASMPVAFHAGVDSKIAYWPRDQLMPVIIKNGEVAWKLCSIMINRMQIASDIVEELAFLPVVGRLAGLLLDTFGEDEHEFVARQLTLDDMAARIGTTREVVCRHLYKFAEKGIIDIRRTELRINDRAFLEQQVSKS
ncbi:MAG: Crp/Fnr family transcriptional regulator [Anaerolineales bacterium]|jgi:CRP/FNR family transcriptional regulator